MASSTNIVLPNLEIKEDFQKKKELLQVVIDEYGPMYIDLCGKAPKEVLKKEMQKLNFLKDIKKQKSLLH